MRVPFMLRRSRTLEQWDAIHDVGMRSAVLLCRAASPHLEVSEGGKVIKMSSAVAQIELLGNTVYAGEDRARRSDPHARSRMGSAKCAGQTRSLRDLWRPR